ncbi:MAG: class I SAM-dependent methyltransferase [Gammaproteobacteria bacterium]|nr:class I SAM-dependent methyltransferase [Gammaproteobacteria bacterium]
MAERYDNDWANLYGSSRRVAIEQIDQHRHRTRGGLSVVDLGIGTGNAIADLQGQVDLGQCTGFDVSPGMLSQAAQKLGPAVELINADAHDASAHLPPTSQDLVLCHFVLGFGDGGHLLEQAFRLLRPGGYLSLATTTRRSFAELYEGRFERYANWIGVKKSLDRLSNPIDHADCRRLLQQHGFDILADRDYRQPVCFRSLRDVRGWALDSGWVVNGEDKHFGLRVAGAWTLIALAMVFLRPLFPVHATCEMSIVLAQKPVAQPSRQFSPQRSSGSDSARKSVAG